ncbi:MAG: hypothetical protein ACI9XO_001158 [Paraglaciecola sp.]|jgi:hypothetical protein
MKFTNILILLIFSTLSLSIPLSATNPAAEARQNYIDQFSNVAMEEMQRSGVPASIILAQGVIESNSGNSQLALDSKNHFGIKCKDWEGRKVYYEDDDYKNGKLIKSCFRAYDDVLDSYADHSKFLLQGERYRWLFDLNRTDYKAWARGLKKSGYATNPEYADIVIKIIDDYMLYIYDTPNPHFVSMNPPVPQRLNNEMIPMAQPMPQNIQNTDNQFIAMNEAVLETPTYQLTNTPKKEPKRRKKLCFKFAKKQVRAADRPMRHGVNAR